MNFSIYRLNSENLIVLQDGEAERVVSELSLNQLFQSDDPFSTIAEAYKGGAPGSDQIGESRGALAPIGDQEIWAAGVTYFRSKTARMEEAESVGGDVFYDKVYEARRPELFFKSTATRARGHGDDVCIRPDSTWDVPEPELTLAINRSGKIFGYTIGNDMSSRSIEGENPLYLPQAKVYTGSCAIGPCLVVRPDKPGEETTIRITITRDGKCEFSGETNVGQIKRGLGELAEFLFHSNEFPLGAYLMTGTGVVPDSDFTLQVGDELEISIDGIGVLRNRVVEA